MDVDQGFGDEGDPGFGEYQGFGDEGDPGFGDEEDQGFGAEGDQGYGEDEGEGEGKGEPEGDGEAEESWDPTSFGAYAFRNPLQAIALLRRTMQEAHPPLICFHTKVNQDQDNPGKWPSFSSDEKYFSYHYHEDMISCPIDFGYIMNHKRETSSEETADAVLRSCFPANIIGLYSTFWKNSTIKKMTKKDKTGLALAMGLRLDNPMFSQTPKDAFKMFTYGAMLWQLLLKVSPTPSDSEMADIRRLCAPDASMRKWPRRGEETVEVEVEVDG
jgi:hypothetical protein